MEISESLLKATALRIHISSRELHDQSRVFRVRRTVSWYFQCLWDTQRCHGSILRTSNMVMHNRVSFILHFCWLSDKASHGSGINLCFKFWCCAMLRSECLWRSATETPYDLLVGGTSPVPHQRLPILFLRLISLRQKNLLLPFASLSTYWSSNMPTRHFFWHALEVCGLRWHLPFAMSPTTLFSSFRLFCSLSEYFLCLNRCLPLASHLGSRFGFWHNCFFFSLNRSPNVSLLLAELLSEDFELAPLSPLSSFPIKFLL